MSIFPLPLAADAISIATLLGMAATLVGASWPLLRRREAMLAGQASGAALFSAHFALLGSPTAALTCVVAIAQIGAAWRVRDRRRLVLANGACLVVLGLIAWQTWRGVPSLLALGGTLLATVGRIEPCDRRMRGWFMGGTFAWIAHNLLVGSVFGLMSDALSVATTGAGMLRNRTQRAVA